MAEEKRLNIAMITYHSLPFLNHQDMDPRNINIGGMDADVGSLVMELDRLGHRVIVYTGNRIDPFETIVHPIGNNSEVIHLPIGVKTYDKKELKERRPIFDEGVLQHIRDREKPNVVHSHYWLSSTAGMAIHSELGSAWIHKFHTEERLKGRFIPRNLIDQSRIEEEDYIAEQADGIVVSTRSCLEDLVSFGVKEEKIHIVSPGFNPDIFYREGQQEARQKLGISSNEYMILGVGRSDPFKNYDHLIQALEIIRDPKIKLYLIGGSFSDTERQRLAIEAENRGVGKQVVFVEMIRPEELRLYYGAADLECITSHHETFGIAGMEAMACGTPVLAYDVGGLHYLIHNPRFLVQSGKIEAYTTRMKEILHDERLRTDMREEVLTHAQNYRIGLTAPKMVEVYRNVMSVSRAA